MHGEIVRTHVWALLYKAITELTWLPSMRDCPLLDVSAAVLETGQVSLAVTNLSPDAGFEVEIEGLGKGSVEVYKVSGADAGAVSTEGDEKVGNSGGDVGWRRQVSVSKAIVHVVADKSLRTRLFAPASREPKEFLAVHRHLHSVASLAFDMPVVSTPTRNEHT